MRDACLALRVAVLSNALLTLAAPVLNAYAEHKEASGLLDYDDLIGRTSNLLVDPGAAWVLYKLDGGLDHLLLDEVQDTAPAQWQIAHALTAEFFAGQGARDADRTVFAVGDRKQSIYSFQGADTEEFDNSHKQLRDAGEGGGKAVARGAVGCVVPLDAAGAGTGGSGVRQSRPPLPALWNTAGRWRITPIAPTMPARWNCGRSHRCPMPPSRSRGQCRSSNQGLTSAPQHLAETLAQWIARQTGGGVMLESRGRPLAPGDVMVLVRRRNDFARALVRALKSRGVPVAGLDRLMLTEQPAVQDLMALADALLLPQDDLTFACFLTSPLGGLSDDSLMELAIGRSGHLWEALRARAGERADWQAAWDFFTALLARVDYASPHALFAEALGPLGGRARLFGRLGPEAAEPVDELLNAALAYAAHASTVAAGFPALAAPIRRGGEARAEGAGGLVRIMTVHGAKGLQAPLVILPDTTSLPPDAGVCSSGRSIRPPAAACRSGRRGGNCAAPQSQRLRDAGGDPANGGAQPAAIRRADPRRGPAGGLRLADRGSGLDDACWYRLVERGFDALPAEREGAFGIWDGDLRRHATPQLAKPDRGTAGGSELPDSDLPRWAGASAGLAGGAATCGARAAGAGSRPVGPRAPNWARCPRPPHRWRRATRRTTVSCAAG